MRAALLANAQRGTEIGALSIKFRFESKNAFVYRWRNCIKFSQIKLDQFQI